MNRHTAFAATIVLMAALCAAPPLSAAAVTILPATIATPMQSALHDRYGAEEAVALQAIVADWLARSLTAAAASLSDGAPIRIEVSIEDAVPSHPTRHQMQQSPGLDPVRSISLGGARLHAMLRDASGQVLDHVDYDHYATSLEEVSLSGDAWGDAMR